jgi:hypothetical protein
VVYSAVKRSRYLSHRQNWTWFDSVEQALNFKQRKAVPLGLTQAELVLFSRPCSSQSRKASDDCSPEPCKKVFRTTVKAYASDRIVLSSSKVPVLEESDRSERRKKTKRGKLVLELDTRRESRRQLKIGSKWRLKPVATRFTTWGKNFVRDATHVIEHDLEGCGVFLTLTFPGRSETSLDVVQFASGYIVDRFNRWLRYKCDGGLFAYVWELTKSGAPHLHYVFKVLRADTVGRIQEECQREWRNILLDVCEQTTCDVFERSGGGTWIGDRRMPFTRAIPIASGLSKYLSKYISKGRSKSGTAHKWCPGRWWACSAPLRKLVLGRRLNVRLDFESSRDGDAFVDNCVSFGGPLFLSQFSPASADVFGAVTMCLTVPPGWSVQIARALQEYARSGSLSDLFSIIEECKSVCNSS